ncbi:MAG: HD domain-containing protein [Akkermansiaceae bacterium]
MPLTADSESHWTPLFIALLEQHTVADAAHDLEHIRRVVTNARRLTAAEAADWEVVMPAAWLHDCVVVPKSSPDRKQASRLAAAQAVAWLTEHAWPFGKLDAISHAIEAHSFSAGIVPRTLEARVMQDADRLDALGAVGLARTLMLGAEMKREFYAADDPFCESRPADDSIYTLDHLFCKLLTLEGTMQTPSGKSEAGRRTIFLTNFLDQLRDEIGSTLDC